MTRFKALPGRDYHHTQALPIRPLGGRGCREVSK